MTVVFIASCSLLVKLEVHGVA